MQSYFERRGPRLDTGLPSVRHVQELIRTRAMVGLHLVGGEVLRGTLRWQDHDFLALEPEPGRPLVLINRNSVAVLRSLG